MFKTFAGVIVLLLSVYSILYLKSVSDKSLVKEVYQQQQMIKEQDLSVQVPTQLPELQLFNSLKSFEQIFNLTKLECGKDEGFENNLQQLKDKIKKHQESHDFNLDYQLQKQDQLFINEFQQKIQSFKDDLEVFMTKKKALVEMKLKYQSFLKEYETQ